MKLCCKCGKVVFVVQDKDGRRFLVAHDGTTTCPTG